MAIDQQKALLFGAAAAVRLLLFTTFPSLPNLLAGRVEVSTPVTGFKRLQEGLFLYTRNVSPYDGGIYHQARHDTIPDCSIGMLIQYRRPFFYRSFRSFRTRLTTRSPQICFIPRWIC